jgi:hypothetical protein
MASICGRDRIWSDGISCDAERKPSTIGATPDFGRSRMLLQVDVKDVYGAA